MARGKKQAAVYMQQLALKAQHYGVATCSTVAEIQAVVQKIQAVVADFTEQNNADHISWM